MNDQPATNPLMRVLRILILVEIALLLLSIPAFFLVDRFLPPQLQEYLASSSEAEISTTEWVSVGLSIPALILYFISWVGLWRSWRTARTLYTIALLLLICTTAFSGPVVTVGFVDCLSTLLSTVTGAILSLIYFSDLRLLYVHRRA